MAPDISKVDTNRHLNQGLPAWYFRNKVLRWLLHGNSLSDPEDLLIPFRGTTGSIFVGQPQPRSGFNFLLQCFP
jgi:hypothetical protein